MKSLMIVLALLAGAPVVHARGEAGRVRICRDGGAGNPAVMETRSPIVLDGLIRSLQVYPRPSERDRTGMEVVTEIVEPIGPQGECREIQAWVSENPDGEPLPKAGQSWRAAAFVRDDRPIAIPPKVLEATTRLARQGFKPYQPWEGGRVGFNVTALEDFKQLPRVPSLPPALPKP